MKGPPATKSKILIVEDDDGVALLERRRLERFGYETVTVSNAESALDRIRLHGAVPPHRPKERWRARPIVPSRLSKVSG